MANVNKFICIGTATRDPELRVTPKGTAICQFSLAVNRKWKDDQGEREETSFFDFEAWGKSGELIAKYVPKGKQVYIEARAKQDSWDDKESGKKRTKIKFVVENFQFMSSGKSDSSDKPKGDQDRSPQTGGGGSLGHTSPSGGDPDDIPFQKFTEPF